MYDGTHIFLVDFSVSTNAVGGVTVMLAITRSTRITVSVQGPGQQTRTGQAHVCVRACVHEFACARACVCNV